MKKLSQENSKAVAVPSNPQGAVNKSPSEASAAKNKSKGRGKAGNSEITSFIDVFSDDLITIREARQAYLTHPLISTIPSICEASFCRIFIVWSVTSIEYLLREWREKDHLKILEAWFAADDSNGHRIQALFEAFKEKGFNCNVGVFEDYLAIKYLRNVIAHQEMREGERYWIEKRGFPTDLAKLSTDHWERLQWIEQNMTTYLAFPTILKHPPNPETAPKSFEPYAQNSSDLPGAILSPIQFRGIALKNLERVHEAIGKMLVKVMNEENAKDDATTLGTEKNDDSELNRMRQRWIKAATAGERGDDRLALAADFNEIALYSWKLYAEDEFARFSLSDCMEARATLVTLLSKSSGDAVCFPATLLKESDDTILPLVSAIFEEESPQIAKTILKALRVGGWAYETIPAIWLPYLFCLYFPAVSPRRRREFLEIGRPLRFSFEVGRLWYALLEGGYSRNDPLKIKLDLLDEALSESWWDVGSGVDAGRYPQDT